MKINILFITTLLFLSGCGGDTESIFNSSKISLYTPNESSLYIQWVEDGRPNLQSKPIPYLPREKTATQSALLQASSSTLIFPDKFDLRDPNSDGDMQDSYISDIRDQGQCGTCWAFAGMGAIEGSYKSTMNFDFSEDNLKHEHAFGDPDDGCRGGYIFSASVYLAGFKGVVNENEDPYSDSPTSEYCATCPSSRYVDNISWYRGRLDNGDVNLALIKELLTTQLKPVQVSIEVPSGSAGEVGTSNYDYDTKSYYQANTPAPNHEVVIVGYDDNKVVQGQQGVFIIKNSYGQSLLSDNGYYYVPYSDKSIGLGLIVTYEDLSEDSFNFDTLYKHDGYGIIGMYAVTSSPLIYGASIYQTSDVDEEIVGINFFNYDEGSSRAFEIHTKTTTTNPSWGDSSTLLGQRVFSSQIYPMGYHTIPLSTPIKIPKNSDFVVLMQVTAPTGEDAAIELDCPHEVAPQHIVFQGKSYLSIDGSSNWLDVTAAYNCNLFTKVMSKNIPAIEPINELPTVEIGLSKLTFDINETLTPSVTAADSDGEISSYLWDFGDGFTSTSEITSHAYSASGTYTLSCLVTDNDGATATDSIDITVNTPPAEPLLVWQDDSDVSTLSKPWLTDANYQTCYDNTQPNGTGGDDPSCHDTTGDTAATYCLELTLDGYTNWRLPTADELIDISDNNFTNDANYSYWSSSELEGVAPSAYFIKTNPAGEIGWNGKNANYSMRCVREQ